MQGNSKKGLRAVRDEMLALYYKQEWLVSCQHETNTGITGTTYRITMLYNLIPTDNNNCYQMDLYLSHFYFVSVWRIPKAQIREPLREVLGEPRGEPQA